MADTCSSVTVTVTVVHWQAALTMYHWHCPEINQLPNQPLNPILRLDRLLGTNQTQVPHFKLNLNSGLHSDHRTASLLISLREAARKVPNCAQPIISAYGTYASAKVSRHSVAAWL